MEDPSQTAETAYEAPPACKALPKGDGSSNGGDASPANAAAAPEPVASPLRNAAVSCLVPGPFDESAAIQAAKACREGLGRDPDLVLAFVSSDFRAPLKRFVETLAIDGRARRIAGCSGGGLLGVGKALENQSGCSLLFLSLPNTAVERVSTGRRRTAPKPPGGGPSGAAAPAGLLAMVHPLRESAGRLLAGLGSSHPGVPVVGGLATGGPDEEGLFLFTESGLSRDPSLVLALRGGVSVGTLVAQSCRPIGRPLIVTAARGDEVLSIGRRPALEVLEETFAGLDAELKALADGNVFAGLATREEVEDFRAGDFLIRQIVSARLEDGRLRLGARPRPGQTLQFQLRESRAAEAQLEAATGGALAACGKPFAVAAFSGRGRGKALFEAEDRDARKLGEAFGTLPLAGCFTHGELGPVGGVNHRHDHSLCAAVLCDEAAP